MSSLAVLAPICEAEGVHQVAHHLMGVHLAPMRTGFRAQVLEPIQQMLHNLRIDGFHTTVWPDDRQALQLA